MYAPLSNGTRATTVTASASPSTKVSPFYAAPGSLPPHPPVVPDDDLEKGAQNPDHSPDDFLLDFAPIKLRNQFIRKVYGIVAAQLMFTFGVALMLNLWDETKSWLKTDGWWMIILGSVLVLVGYCALACVTDLAKKVPANYILLSVMTVGFAITMAYAGATAGTNTFLIALGMTLMLVVALTLFAFQTRFDFTGCGPFVLVLLLVLLLFGVISAVVRNNIFRIVYASIGVMVFGFYLVYDTQVIVGGKHRSSKYSIDDYVFGAISLYIDVINLFTHLLSLINCAG